MCATLLYKSTPSAFAHMSHRGGYTISMEMTHHCECRRFVLVLLGWHLAWHHRLPTQLVILHSLVCRVAQLRRLYGIGRFGLRFVSACAEPRV